MKIRHKLITSFLFIALLGIFTGGIDYYGIQQVTKAFHNITNETVPELLLMNELKDDVLHYGELIETIDVNEADLTEIQEKLRYELRTNIIKLTRELEKERKKIVSESELLEYGYRERTVEAIEFYILIVDELYKNIKTKERDQVEDLIEQSETIQLGAVEALEEDNEYELKELKEEEKLAIDTINISKVVLLLVSVFGIILSIFLGWYFSRTVSKPVEKIIASLKAYTKGDEHQQIQVFSKDEMGTLSRFINEVYKELNEHRNLLEQKVEERTQDLTKSQKMLEESLEKEKQLSQLKSVFVSTASHQFRTPMAIIQSNSELLQMISTNSKEELKFQKVIERIKSEILNMTKLMDEILILGKITSGNMPYHPELVDLVKIIEKLIEKTNHIQTDGRKMEFTVSGNPYQLMTDEQLLSHSLTNLLSNAFKYSPGTVNPETHLQFEKDKIIIQVKDAGIGIPNNELHHLFQPFYRATNTNGIKGTGLGLSIAKEYIEINKGTIEVISIPNKETIFTITIPKI